MVATTQAEGLLARIASGDRSAFNDCVDQHGGLVWSIVSRCFSSRHDQEDISQDIFLALWNNAHRYDPAQGSESTFIAVIARRRVIDHLRRRQRDVSQVTIGEDGVEPTSDDQPSDAISQQEQVGKVHEAMKSLRDQEQAVLRLAILQGMSHQQISNQLEIPLGTVKSLARRGMLRLRELLSSEGSAGKEGSA